MTGYNGLKFGNAKVEESLQFAEISPASAGPGAVHISRLSFCIATMLCHILLKFRLRRTAILRKTDGWVTGYAWGWMHMTLCLLEISR